MQCRYIIARLVQDLVRDEPVNVGIILQSDEYVSCRFVPRIPRALVTDEELAHDILPDLQKSWEAKLSRGRDWIFVPERHQVEISFTDPLFLEWLRASFSRHLQFGGVREADVKIESKFNFDTLLEHLYTTFVSPKPTARRPVTAMGTRLHTVLRRDFRQLQLLDKITDGGLVEGTILWQVDFTYRNHREVAISALDFNIRGLFEKAGDILAAWADIKEVRKEAVIRVSVVNNFKQTPEHRKALSLVERYAAQTYNYEIEKPKILDLVSTDLQTGRLA